MANKTITGIKVGSTNINVSFTDGVTTQTASASIEVVRAAGSVSTAPVNANAVYGSGNKLCSSGSGTGTMMYRVGTTGNFSSTIPTTNGLNAGTYTLYYYAAQSDNYEQSGTGSISVVIQKATPTLTLTNVNSTYPTAGVIKATTSVAGKVYSGTSTSSMTTETTVSANSTKTIYTKSSCGSTTIYAYFVPTDTTNYNSTSSSPVSKTVSVAKASGTVSISNSNVSYNSGKNLVSVSNATGTVYYRLGTSGSFSTTIPTATSSLNATSYTLYYYVAASSNYTEFGNASSPKSLNVTIAKASNQITISPTSKTIYDRSGYNSFYLTVSNHKGTPTTSVNTSGKVTISSFDSTNARFTVTYAGAGSVTITVSDSSTNYTSSSATCVVTTKVDTISSYGSVSAPSVSQKTNFPASGVTLTSSNMSTYFTVSGSTQTNTWTSGYKSSGSISYSWSVSSGTVASKGTTISNASTVEINATVTAAGEGSKTASKVVTSGTQAGNYVTAIAAKSSSNTDGTHFSYANIGAGTTSASPSLSGGALYTFSSGSTSFDSSSSPSFGGTASYTRSYTLASSQNGFTAVNSSTGVLTATSRGKVTGAARTSSNVTGTLVVKYTHTSTYSAGGTVTSSTKSNTQTCTQNANYLTWGDPVLTVSSPATPYPMAVSGETKAITASATQSATYSSGATDTYTPTISYTVKTAKSGYSLSNNSVTVTNNTSTSVRNGFVVTVTAKGKTGTNSTYESGYNKTATSDRIFNQAAGTIVYAVPTISTYSYATYAAAGATKTPTVSYSQTWTWNGVSGSGGTITSGGTLAFTKGTLTSGATAGSSFAADGTITWGNNTTTSTRSTHSALNVTVTLNSKTSSAKACTSCTQSAGAKVYGTPTVTFAYTNTAASGVTNKTPTTVAYSQPWTWNGVSGSGGTVTSGLTLSYSTTGTLPTGFSKGTNFATTGAITWASRGTTVGSQLNANSNIVLSIPFADKTRTYNPTGCTQSANELTNTNYSPSNYTVSVSIGNGLTAGGGSATVTASASHKAYDLYTSGSYNNQHTVTDTARWMITSNGNNRFSHPSSGGTSLSGVGTVYDSGTSVSHSNMTTNATTDTVTVTAYNTTNSSTTATATKSITNTKDNTNYAPYNYTASVSIGNGLTAGGGSATVTASASHMAYDYYTSGSYNNSHSVTDSVTWSISTQTFTPSGGSVSTITRFSKSGNTLSHTSMTSNVGTDYVKVTATNSSNTSTTSSAEKSITNELGTQKYKNTSGTTGYNIVYNVPTVSIGSGLNAAGGDATVTCSVTNGTNWYQKYTSGTYTGQQTSTEAGTARWMITSNGNSRFSHPSSGGTSLSGVGAVYNTGTKVYHSNMTTNATTDTVTVTAYNIGDTSKTKTASVSVSNAVVSISLALAQTTIVDGNTTTTTVTATYTSGSKGTITPTSVSSSDGTVVEVL